MVRTNQNERTTSEHSPQFPTGIPGKFLFHLHPWPILLISSPDFAFVSRRHPVGREKSGDEITTIPYLIPYHTTPHRTAPHQTIHRTVPYHTIPYHTIPYHTMPYHTTHHTVPYHTIPYTGLKIMAGRRTISGLIGALTSQTFTVSPVMLTGHVVTFIVMLLKLFK